MPEDRVSQQNMPWLFNLLYREAIYLSNVIVESAVNLR